MNARYREQVGFFYDLVKANVSRIILALTHELRDTSVTALGVTPGWLRSEAMLEGFGVTEETWRDALARIPGFAISESPAYVARGLAALAQDPEVAQFAGQVLTARQLADRYGVTDADGSRPDAWATSRPTAWRNRAAGTSNGSAECIPKRPLGRRVAGTAADCVT